MKVKELMTSEVVSVSAETTLKDVALLLGRHRISGVPVCDAEGHVLGIVSEGDILMKEQGPTASPGILAWAFESRKAAEAKLAARTAGDAMTTPAVTVSPERPASAAARIMVERGVNRLPVVRDGQLVGILSRADLVRAFTRGDEELADEIRQEVVERALWLSPEEIGVTVIDGAVVLAGELETRTDAEVLERLAARVPGVVSVTSEVTWRTDDRRVLAPR